MKNRTNRSTGGFRRITRLVPQVEIRVFGFAMVVICGSILVAWLMHSLWSQLGQLQRDYAAVQSESFYFGVHLRNSLRGLNSQLLQFAISHDPAIPGAFLNDAADLKNRISTNQSRLEDIASLQLLRSADFSEQTHILQSIPVEFDAYMTGATALFAQTNAAVSAISFETTYRKVREISGRLIPLSDDLVSAQREGFVEFIRGTQDTLARHNRLLTITSMMILILVVLLAHMAYRGMIAPLRVGLSESRSIIERQEKLASLGILASGVAHEVRNPITAIKFRLFSLQKAVPGLSQNEDAATIGNEINRLETIVQDFLEFARPSEPKLARTQASQILAEVYNLMNPQLERAGISLKLEPSDATHVYADSQQVKQVFINLIQNAAESIGRNGSITLLIRREMVEIDGRDRLAAVFAIQDTGQGIPSDVQSRLFDPFFTTKEGGTGLGLAISARIVEKHGGLLRYETELNQGTTFEVVLPAAEDNAGKQGR